MSNEATDKGWILHSLAQARRFGPMSEDELRGYFRAGMVKSVDRLTAPGEFAMRSAAEVAAMLGENVPAGPAPPELTEMPTPLPSMATTVAKEADEARAAKAAAALNIDIAALMATSAPAQRRSGWLLPVIVVVVMVMLLLVGLNMLRKMGAAATQESAEYGPTPIDGPIVTNAADAPVPVGTDAAPAPGAAAPSAPDPIFEEHLTRAQALQDTRNWAGLVEFSREWAQAQPDRNEPYQYLGVAYSGLGDYKLAIEPLQKVYARDPDNAPARSLLADAYLQSERWTEAAGMYKQMVVVAPKDARLWNNYGAALNASGQQMQAVAAMETAVSLDPAFKQAWTNLGNLYQSMGDTERASAAFANAR